MRGALLIGVAVVIGVVLLGKGLDTGIVPSANGNDNGEQASGNGDSNGSTDGNGDNNGSSDGNGTIETTTTLGEPHPPAEVKVFVLNGSGASGVAGAAKTKADTAGYTTVDPANAVENVSATLIYYIEGFQADAYAIATVMGITPSAANVLPLPDPVPPQVPGGDIKGANVIVILGPDAPPAG